MEAVRYVGHDRKLICGRCGMIWHPMRCFQLPNSIPTPCRSQILSSNYTIWGDWGGKVDVIHCTFDQYCELLWTGTANMLWLSFVYWMVMQQCMACFCGPQVVGENDWTPGGFYEAGSRSVWWIPLPEPDLWQHLPDSGIASCLTALQGKMKKAAVP